MFLIVYYVGSRLHFNYRDAVAVAFNATGRDFEIAIAIAITAFNPTVALATVVGPLIEAPVMLTLVWDRHARRETVVRHRVGPAGPGKQRQHLSLPSNMTFRGRRFSKQIGFTPAPSVNKSKKYVSASALPDRYVGLRQGRVQLPD